VGLGGIRERGGWFDSHSDFGQDHGSINPGEPHGAVQKTRGEMDIAATEVDDRRGDILYLSKSSRTPVQDAPKKN